MKYRWISLSVAGALLLGSANAGRRPTKRPAAAAAHLHKDHGAIAFAHDQVDLTTAAPGRPIIALQQLQALRLQIGQRPVFGRIAALARSARCRARRHRSNARQSRLHRLFSKEFH